MPRGLQAQDFARRRRELMNLLAPGSIAIIAGAHLRLRNGDVEYRFRQDSGFHYLTGFAEPDAVLALIPGREQAEAILFCAEADAESERWFGDIVGPERAAEMLTVDDAFPLSDMDDILPALMESCERLYYSLGSDGLFDERVIGWLGTTGERQVAEGSTPTELCQLQPLLDEMRLVKTAAEIRLIRQAAAITTQAHREVMAMVSPGVSEHAVQTELEYRFALAGARAPAYPSIVASGTNSAVLHYTRNSDRMAEGDLVVIDAGCELACYASDVTRTLPVSGEFSPVQRALYEIVLAAQRAAFAAVQPGHHWNDPHEAAVRAISAGLLELGILAGSLEQVIAEESYRPYYMHRTGHWIGLDVHDAGEYQIEGQWRVLEPGMVMTIEPGLYFSVDAEVAPEYRGLGLRIEDMVLVTRDGHEVLTEDLPRSVADVEAAMRGVSEQPAMRLVTP